MSQMNEAMMKAEIERLRKENAALKAQPVVIVKKVAPKISYKVSAEKKALSVYGLGTRPVTMYLGQWERLFADMDNMKKFIEEHRSEFAVKEQAQQAAS